MTTSNEQDPDECAGFCPKMVKADIALTAATEVNILPALQAAVDQLSSIAQEGCNSTKAKCCRYLYTQILAKWFPTIMKVKATPRSKEVEAVITSIEASNTLPAEEKSRLKRLLGR